MIPIRYSLRNMRVRWKPTLTTAVTFTLVVAASVVMFAFVQGVMLVCRRSGEPENVIVLQNGINDELLSQLDDDTADRVESVGGIRRDSNGVPLVSRELFMVVSYQAPQSGEYFFRQVRGVDSAAFEVHRNVRMVQGKRFRPQFREVIVGSRMARQLGLEIGSDLDIGGQPWRVAGFFEAAGGVFETEVWCPRTMLAAQFRRLGEATTVVLRGKDAERAPGLAETIRGRFRNRIVANVETDYYERQAEQVERLRAGAVVIAGLMSIGAVFSVMNTMFASIRHRRQDLATMRMIGFRRREILICILLESLVISLAGGMAGCALGLCFNDLSMTAPVGFRDLGFAFQVDSRVVAWGIGFSVALGLVGGAIPAIVAMRVTPLQAMRN